MNRGDRREDIFEDDKDRRGFLETLGQTCDKTGRQVRAYCFMSNLARSAPGKRFGWVRVERLLGEWGILKGSPAGRRRFGLYMEHGACGACGGGGPVHISVTV